MDLNGSEFCLGSKSFTVSPLGGIVLDNPREFDSLFGSISLHYSSVPTADINKKTKFPSERSDEGP